MSCHFEAEMHTDLGCWTASHSFSGYMCAFGHLFENNENHRRCNSVMRPEAWQVSWDKRPIKASKVPSACLWSTSVSTCTQ